MTRGATANANFRAFYPADGEINSKRCGEFRPKSVIADRPDPLALSVFRHNSQLTLTLERPREAVRLYFPPRQIAGSGGEAPGPEPSSMI